MPCTPPVSYSAFFFVLALSPCAVVCRRDGKRERYGGRLHYWPRTHGDRRYKTNRYEYFNFFDTRTCITWRVGRLRVRNARGASWYAIFVLQNFLAKK